MVLCQGSFLGSFIGCILRGNRALRTQGQAVKPLSRLGGESSSDGEKSRQMNQVAWAGLAWRLLRVPWGIAGLAKAVNLWMVAYLLTENLMMEVGYFLVLYFAFSIKECKRRETGQL